MVCLSLSAVSACTQVPVETCRRILIDLFQAVAETSRRSAKEVKLTFKKCGNLYLFKNRELCFQMVGDDSTSSQLRLERSKLRDDISVIDSASAVLSRG